MIALREGRAGNLSHARALAHRGDVANFGAFVDIGVRQDDQTGAAAQAEEVAPPPIS